MPHWTDEQWQHAADVAQFYLHAGGEQLAAVLGHPSVDVDRCELVQREAAELGFMPKSKDDLIKSDPRLSFLKPAPKSAELEERQTRQVVEEP